MNRNRDQGRPYVPGLVPIMPTAAEFLSENISLQFLFADASAFARTKCPSDDEVHIYLLRQGSLERRFGDRAELVSSSDIHVTRYAGNSTVETTGTRSIGICIVCKRKYLLDYFELDLRVFDRWRDPIATVYNGRIVCMVESKNAVRAWLDRWRMPASR